VDTGRVLPADDVLVAGLRSGDEATFARLLDSWSASMLRLARSFVSILVNTAKKRGVKEKRTVPWTSLDPDGGPTVDPDRFRGPGDAYPGHWREFPEPWVLGDEFRHVVARALDQLPERQRVVVTLRDVDGHSSEEVCAMLEISAANQRVLLHRGRAAVRAHVEKYLGGAA
jgi:RNA polymerase sigma-70 factor (ECF subfamily)